MSDSLFVLMELISRLKQTPAVTKTKILAIYAVAGLLLTIFLPGKLVNYWFSVHSGHQYNSCLAVVFVLAYAVFFQNLLRIKDWALAGDKPRFTAERLAHFDISFEMLAELLSLPEHMKIEAVGEFGPSWMRNHAFTVVVSGKYLPKQKKGALRPPVVTLCFRQLEGWELESNSLSRIKVTRIEGLDT